MATQFLLPELGENIDSVDVSAILVATGDVVRKDQPVLEVETEKASLEVPVPFAGRVTEVHVQSGSKIKVGDPVITVDAEESAAVAEPAATAREEFQQPPADDTRESLRPELERIDPQGVPDSPPAAAEEPPAAPADEPASRAAGATPSAPRELGDPAPASPSVRRLARELGIAIDWVPGSGPGGRIGADDVKRFAKSQLSAGRDAGTRGEPGSPAPRKLPDFENWGEIERQPLTGIRARTAENLSRAWNTVPHVTQFDKADITEILRLRKELGARPALRGTKLTVTAIVLKVAASALRVFPKFNASLDEQRGELVLKKYLHLGVAVDTERGLLVPVIRDADRKNIAELGVELAELAAKARDRKLTPDQMQGACFTISNLGGLGTTYFSPIVNWPEVAILGIGRAELQPVHRDGGFVPRSIMPLSLSYDHRVIDGADAARFLRWVAEALEQPLLLSLEG